eukprot:scaffold1330_cov240-Pinguiococcus_pyrenoidosus.AAC.42
MGVGQRTDSFSRRGMQLFVEIPQALLRSRTSPRAAVGSAHTCGTRYSTAPSPSECQRVFTSSGCRAKGPSLSFERGRPQDRKHKHTKSSLAQSRSSSS